MPYRASSQPPDGNDTGRVADVLELVLRPMRPEDRNYVLSSWLRSAAESLEFRRMARSVFFRLYAPVVVDMVDRSTVAVATLPEAPDVVLGWLAVEGDTLHYVLTKPRWRQLGIATFLLRDLAQLPAMYTHRFPPEASSLAPDTWRYEPHRRFKQEK